MQLTISTLSARDDAGSGVFGHLARRWIHEGPSVMVLGGALVGAAGAGLSLFHVPTALYVTLAGVTWMLLWTVFLANVALRGHRR